eukprot:3818159-Prymnesium_polylepis.1
MQLRGAAPLTVQGQVQQLINDATEISNLAQMYAAGRRTTMLCWRAHTHAHTRGRALAYHSAYPRRFVR